MIVVGAIVTAGRNNETMHEPGNRPGACGVVAAFLTAGLLVTLAAPGCRRDGTSVASPAESPLNVLLITLDTTRADFLGCYGRTSARTPNLDQLAADGVLFLRCSASSSLTLPSHASIMTGLYPFEHGARTNGSHRLAPSLNTLAEVMKDQGYNTHAILAASVLNAQYGMGQGFSVYEDVPVKGSQNTIAQRRATEISDRAIAALQGQEGKFFFWVHYYDPHYPYLSDRVNATDIERYEDEIAYVDREIGRLLDTLRERGLFENTLIVVVADHGEGLGEHEESGHGYFAFETTLHVPLVVHCPRLLTGGRSIGNLVRTIDVAPTILSLVGAPALEDVSGQDLSTLLHQGHATTDFVAYGEALECHYHFNLSRIRTLTTQKWKYVLAPKRQLFQIDRDPHEAHDVLPENLDIAEGLHEQLKMLIAVSTLRPSTQDSTHRPDVLDRAALESLGYIAPATTTNESGDVREIDEFEPQGDDPRDYAAAIELFIQARRAMGEQDDERALEIFPKVLEALPSSIWARANYAHTLQRRKRFDEARQEYEAALRQDPQSTYARRMYGGLLVETKRWIEAEEQFRIVITSDPADAEAWYNMGTVLAAQNRMDEARRHLAQAAALEPRDPRSLNTIGVLYAKEKDFDNAIEYFRRALRVDPSHEKSKRDLQTALRIAQQPK